MTFTTFMMFTILPVERRTYGLAIPASRVSASKHFTNEVNLGTRYLRQERLATGSRHGRPSDPPPHRSNRTTRGLLFPGGKCPYGIPQDSSPMCGLSGLTLLISSFHDPDFQVFALKSRENGECPPLFAVSDGR